MTFNEINNQAASPNAHNLIQEGAVLLKDGDDAEFMMYQSGIYGLAASAMRVQLGLAVNPDFMIGCMIGYVPVYAASCKPEDMVMMEEARHKKYWFLDVQNQILGEKGLEY